MKFDIELPYTNIYSLKNTDVCVLAHNEQKYITLEINKHNYEHITSLIFANSCINPLTLPTFSDKNLIKCSDNSKLLIELLKSTYSFLSKLPNTESITLCSKIDRVLDSLNDNNAIVNKDYTYLIDRSTHSKHSNPLDFNYKGYNTLLDFIIKSFELLGKNEIPSFSYYPNNFSFINEDISITSKSMSLVIHNEKDYKKFTNFLSSFAYYSNHEDNIKFIKSAIYLLSHKNNIDLPDSTSSSAISQEVVSNFGTLNSGLRMYLAYLYKQIFKDKKLYVFSYSTYSPYSVYFDNGINKYTDSTRNLILNSVNTPAFLAPITKSKHLKIKPVNLSFSDIEISDLVRIYTKDINSIKALHNLVSYIKPQTYFNKFTKSAKIDNVLTRIDDIMSSNPIGKDCVSFLDNSPISKLKYSRINISRYAYDIKSDLYLSTYNPVNESFPAFKEAVKYVNRTYKTHSGGVTSVIPILATIVNLIPHSFLSYFKKVQPKTAIACDYQIKLLIVLNYMFGKSLSSLITSNTYNHENVGGLLYSVQSDKEFKQIKYTIHRDTYNYIISKINNANYLDYKCDPILFCSPQVQYSPKYLKPNIPVADTVRKYNNISIKLK